MPIKFIAFCARTQKNNTKTWHANDLYQKLTCQLISTKKVAFTICYLQFCKSYFTKLTQTFKLFKKSKYRITKVAIKTTFFAAFIIFLLKKNACFVNIIFYNKILLFLSWFFELDAKWKSGAISEIKGSIQHKCKRELFPDKKL